MTFWRILRAIVVAPFAGVIAIGCMIAIWRALLPDPGFDVVDGIIFYATFGLPIAFIATIFLGLPTAWLLRRFSTGSVLQHATVGAGFGFLIGLMMFGNVTMNSDAMIFNLCLTAVPGASVAAAFAHIAGTDTRLPNRAEN